MWGVLGMITGYIFALVSSRLQRPGYALELCNRSSLHTETVSSSLRAGAAHTLHLEQVSIVMQDVLPTE